MNTVSQAIMARKALVMFRGTATDDERVAAAAVDELESLLAIFSAYRDELRAQSKLPRGELRAALHEALAAVERDDIDGLSAAVLRVADVLRGKR